MARKPLFLAWDAGVTVGPGSVGGGGSRAGNFGGGAGVGMVNLQGLVQVGDAHGYFEQCFPVLVGVHERGGLWDLFAEHAEVPQAQVAVKAGVLFSTYEGTHEAELPVNGVQVHTVSMRYEVVE